MFLRRAALNSLGSTPTNDVRGTETRFGLAIGGTVRKGSSDIDTFGYAQGVYGFNAKVALCTIDLCVSK